MAIVRRYGLLLLCAAAASFGCDDTSHDDDGSDGGGASELTGGGGSSVGGNSGVGGNGSGASGSGASGSGAGGSGPGPGDPYGSCGSGGPVGQQQTVTLAGGYYLVWAPPGDPTKPLPLVVALHGDEGNPDDVVAHYWDPIWAARQDFIVVTPACPGAQGSWWKDDHVAHAAFINNVLADVAGGHNVDIDRMYVIGYSGGSCFMSKHITEFQDIFAAGQWTCGGCGTSYVAPPKPSCKIDARFHISADDFMLWGAEMTRDVLQAEGHEIDWSTPSCSGHCCDTFVQQTNEDALAWFLQRTKCDGNAGSGCGSITDIP